jgi:hypothetical protein
MTLDEKGTKKLEITWTLMGFARFHTRNTVVSRVSARTHLPLPILGYTTDTLQLGR